MSKNHEQHLSPTEVETRIEVMRDILSQHKEIFVNLHKNPTLNSLITIRAMERNRPIHTPDDLDQESRSEFIRRTRHGLDVRSGGSARLDAGDEPFGQEAKQYLDILRDTYHMDKNVQPSKSNYNLAIIPANRAENTLARFDYFDGFRNDELNPLTVDTYVIPASYRKTRETPDDRGLTEIEAVSNRGYSLATDTDGNLIQGAPARTEFDYGVNVLQHANNVSASEITHFISADNRVPASKKFQKRSEIAYFVDNKDTVGAALSSPMVHGNRYYDTLDRGEIRRERPNTNDNAIMVDDMLWDVKKNGELPTVLLVTESIYKFQQIIFESMFARKGIRVESIYVNSETAGLPDYTDANYGQEILSMLIQLDESITELEQELESLLRMHGHTALSALGASS